MAVEHVKYPESPFDCLEELGISGEAVFHTVFNGVIGGDIEGFEVQGNLGPFYFSIEIAVWICP